MNEKMMVTLGELKSAIADLDDDLLLSFPVGILGKTVHCGVSSVARADDPLLGEVEKYVPDTTVGELDASSRALMGVLSPEIQAALLGQKSPADALKDAAAAAAPLLQK